MLTRSIKLFLDDESGSASIKGVIKASIILATIISSCSRNSPQPQSNPSFHANNVEPISLQDSTYTARHADHADHQNSLQ